ncbi:MAG: hypothetical protein LJF04_02540 [Gemmatimonadetes bacterium]|nr:hypothetical protein [Gemmatimonadota bacterium]
MSKKQTVLAMLALAMCGVRPLGAQDAARATPDTVPDSRTAAWLVPGVPDTVRVLVEASYTADSDRAKKLLKEAEVQARSAVEGHEDDVGRRFALAVVLGLRASREGGRTKVLAASALYKELQAILALDPENARARHMLGRLQAGVLRMSRVTRWIATNLLGGGELKKANWKEAESNLVFAEEHAPEVSDHHLQLAYLYRDTERPELALREVSHVLALPAVSPMEKEVRAEALRLQERLKDRAGG